MKRVCYILILSVFIFTACSQSSSEEQANPEEQLKAENLVKSYFEELDNRLFEASYPVKIEGQSCYRIVVTGKLDNGETYPLETIAVNPNDDSRYFYDLSKKKYQRFYTTPTFACQTSPDGRLRIESVGMTENGDASSGLYALNEMRILDLSSGEVLWTAESYLANVFLWSEDSRFVAAQCSGRQWVSTTVVDAADFSSVIMPEIEQLQKDDPTVESPEFKAQMPCFRIDKWTGPAVLRVKFEWMKNDDTVVAGEYEYNMANRTFFIQRMDEDG